MSEFIERKIVIASITNTDYLNKLMSIWNPRAFEAPEALMICNWCMDYFIKYQKAPNDNIEGIYTDKLKTLSKDQAEWIEDILTSLSDESIENTIDVPILYDQTRKYFNERYLRITAEDILYELDAGNSQQAAQLINNFVVPEDTSPQTIDPFSKAVLPKLFQAFSGRKDPLIKFPKALGKFWQQEFTKNSFIAIMGAEKRGKSFILLELALQSVRSGNKTVYFQAGDMTEEQQLRRIGIYLTKKSDEERYCRAMWVPIVDCVKHQLDTCDEACREANDRIFNQAQELNYDNLVRAVEANPDHVTCHNCADIEGAPWLKLAPAVSPLTPSEAYKAFKEFGRKYQNNFRLDTHANETLSVQGIKKSLTLWEKQDNFSPTVIVIDYADLLLPDPDCSRLDFRQQQNKIWQRLRNLSQERECLVITATQIKADGYGKRLLGLDDFSEDKRKAAHVTALYGLNQTMEEKQIGMMRINEIVVRDSDYNSTKPIKILQRLQMGRPIIGSWL